MFGTRRQVSIGESLVRFASVYFQSVPKTFSKKISPVVFDTNCSFQKKYISGYI